MPKKINYSPDQLKKLQATNASNRISAPINKGNKVNKATYEKGGNLPVLTTADGKEIVIPKRPASVGKSFFLSIIASILIGLLFLLGALLIAQGNSVQSIAATKAVLDEQKGLINSFKQERNLAPTSDSLNRMFTAYANITVIKGDHTMYGGGTTITSDGNILTTYNLIKNADSIIVSLPQKQGSFQASIVGSDPSSDLSVIKISVPGGISIGTPGDSSKAYSGMYVAGLGNANGYTNSFNQGTLIHQSRNVLGEAGEFGQVYYANMLQVPSSFNHVLAEGGPVFNSDGLFMGVLTSALSRIDSNVGELVIPSNYALAIATDLASGKEARHATLGVQTEKLTNEDAAALGLTSSAGAKVTGVVPGSAAEVVGLTIDDVIVSYNGYPILNPDDLNLKVRGTGVNKSSITYMRSGKEMKTEITPTEDR